MSAQNELTEDGLVFSFHVSKIQGFEEIWKLFQQECTIPEEFDPKLYKKHVTQPDFLPVIRSMDFPPSAEYLEDEKTRESVMERLGQLENAYPHRLWSAFSGVISLRGAAYAETNEQIRKSICDYFGDETIPLRGSFLYPPQGFREWHTNIHDMSGWRMYIVNVDREKKSFFRYMDPNTHELKTIWDRKGQVNIFKIDTEKPIWHCVKSLNTNRWSKGFRIPDNWQEIMKLT